MEEQIIYLLIAGAVGALVKEILQDGGLILPKVKDGRLNLGFIGSACIGAFVGYVVDGSYLTACMGGFVGFSAIEKLIPLKFNAPTKKKEEKIPKKEDLDISDKDKIAGIIRLIAKEQGIDPALAVAVARAESNLSPTAINVNTGGSRDRGLFQINEHWHPKVTDENAFDIVFSTKFFCSAVKNGNLYWWNASKKNWNVDGKYNDMLK